MSTTGRGTRKHSKREKNPFSLPNEGQFLAYYHYLRTAKQIPESKKISRKELCGYSQEAKRRALEARKLDSSTNFMKELITKSSGKSFSKLCYVQDIRLLCKMRLLLGKKRDGCILLDHKLDMEHKKYMAVKRQYTECVKALEQFLEIDHNESMDALSRTSAEINRTEELSKRRDELSHLYGEARLEVYKWEESWHTVKACHHFVHRISSHRPSDSTMNSDDDSTVQANNKESTTSIVCKPTDNELNNATSLDSLIETFEKEVSELSSSQFKNPMDLGLFKAEDILQAFREIELQNLNALIHLESLNGPMSEMISKIDVAEECIKSEIDHVLDDIRYLEVEIEREERREELLEHRSDQLIDETLRMLITSPQALQVRILVEDAYESCVAKNVSGLEPLAMAHAIESTYERLNSELDQLPRHLVLECEREGFRKELRETREAEDAAKKFELMHRLLAAVKRLMEPTEPKRRVLMKRSVPKENKIKKDETITPSNEKSSINYFSRDCK